MLRMTASSRFKHVTISDRVNERQSQSLQLFCDYTYKLYMSSHDTSIV